MSVIFKKKIISILPSSNIDYVKHQYVIFKHTAKGVNFSCIEKSKINEYHNNKILDFINSFKEPMYEVLFNNEPTKIYLDCDFTNIDLSQFQNKNEIIIKLNY
jgi:hypothetical protein